PAIAYTIYPYSTILERVVGHNAKRYFKICSAYCAEFCCCKFGLRLFVHLSNEFIYIGNYLSFSRIVYFVCVVARLVIILMRACKEKQNRNAFIIKRCMV